MILLFTSENCKWCEVLKDMIEEDGQDMQSETDILEIDVSRFRQIAEAYGVLVVPTLVSHTDTLSGLPASDDLRSFLLKAASETRAHSTADTPDLICRAVQLQKAARFAGDLDDNASISEPYETPEAEMKAQTPEKSCADSPSRIERPAQ
jgi:thiol-disulfide isomerase/thioredoxin